MTILAGIGTVDVGGVFACGIDTVVARSAIATDR